MSDTESRVASLPPSAKLVYKTLEYEGRLTQSELATESRLPQRTVRHALRKLEDAGAVEEAVYLMDARKSMYMTAGDQESEAAAAL
ncbi:MAG: DNA-binding Lrp family transcriptional regulator [Natronomonas sp.]|jgi:DNA-binding Lrp family transcriptional regulator|uniref:winged helix-turn-helix domain-containing protein n=1 Tax=Natronomonas sp. TaxID=2184060 RepID=UPI003988ECD4